MRTIALIGNPNSGKTTIFNGLTGSDQQTGNWPGVTVEKIEGVAKLGRNDSAASGQQPADGEEVKVVDLPGLYSLNAANEDEKATFRYVLGHEADLYVNVVDATALERNLYLTLQMCELEVPMIVVVTMMDIARQRNLTVELSHLSQHLGVPVIGVNAANPLGIRRIAAQLAEGRIPTVRLDYGNELEQEIDILSSCTVKTARGLKVSQRWVAIKALEGEPFVTKALIDYHDMAPEVIEGAIDRVTKVLADPPDIELAEARYGIISGLVKDVVHLRQSKQFFSEIVDRFVLNRILGLPLFLAIMAGVFGLVSFMGGMPTELFHSFGAKVFQSLPAEFAGSALGAPAWVVAVVGAIGGAINTLFSFIPVIFTMFLTLAVLEDSGYISRAAFIADRFMRSVGLPGKSFVPLLLGFGCTVPAILATRMLDSKRDRLLTIFMIPFMSCGAKLPVYAAFAVAFSPEHPWKLMLAVYLVGIVLGMLVGLALKKTLFRGEPTHFIMELPPYHLPRPRHILLHSVENLLCFLRRAEFIVPMMLVMGLLNSFDIHGRAKTDDAVASGDTLLSVVGRVSTPVFEPIGVERDNWAASVAVFTGLFAKESVIGTLNGLYAQEQEEAKARPEKADVAEPAREDGNSRGVLRRHFSKGFHQAFAYLLFILLYVPCVGATAVVFKEIGKAYGCIFVAYMTLLGWSVATMYHAVMVSQSILWFTVGAALLAAMFAGFWLYGRRHRVDMI